MGLPFVFALPSSPLVPLADTPVFLTRIQPKQTLEITLSNLYHK